MNSGIDTATERNVVAFSEADAPAVIPTSLVLADESGREIFLMRADGSALADLAGITRARNRFLAGDTTDASRLAAALWNARNAS